MTKSEFIKPELDIDRAAKELAGHTLTYETLKAILSDHFTQSQDVWERYAKSPEFAAKMEAAFADVEAGRYESFDTIEGLIEYINKQCKPKQSQGDKIDFDVDTFVEVEPFDREKAEAFHTEIQKVRAKKQGVDVEALVDEIEKSSFTYLTPRDTTAIEKVVRDHLTDIGPLKAEFKQVSEYLEIVTDHKVELAKENHSFKLRIAELGEKLDRISKMRVNMRKRDEPHGIIKDSHIITAIEIVTLEDKCFSRAALKEGAK